MPRLLALVALFGALSQCDRPVGQAWRASDASGDKPGIGYELRNENGKVAGDAYILDPDHPHDFAHGRRAAMTLITQSPTEITFRVQWNRDLRAVLRFQFKAAEWPDSFQATVAEIIDSQPYDSETFSFAKAR
jgi:hypothetical protein